MPLVPTNRMLPMKNALVATSGLFCALAAHAGVTLSADGVGNTYELIESKKFGIEVPDCGHNVRHVREAFDSTLEKYVFAFDIHRDLDDDRCSATDRQRVEIKTSPEGSPTQQHTRGETSHYRWKFKLPAGFQPSPSFTHIYQLKAYGGDDDSPILTLTPRYGNPSKLQVIYTGSSNSGVKAEVNLAPFISTWVEAYVRVYHDDSGHMQVNLRRLSDGASLLSWKSGTLDTWRSGATYNRGKWGIYRSLDNISYLRDETVFFADWCVTEAAKRDCPSDVKK